LEVV
jgi:hypothetical protein